MRYFASILFFILLLPFEMSTYASTKDGFVKITSEKELNGVYLNRNKDGDILSLFNIPDYANFVTLEFENPNELKLTYKNDSPEQKEFVFKGQMKKKFFEYYFEKKRIVIPILYSSTDVDRIRIGLSKDGRLYIEKYINHMGNLLILVGGSGKEYKRSFNKLSEYENYIPFEDMGLWGYNDASGNLAISPKYDFACIFENDIARVREKGKWGLINKSGDEITTEAYDSISLINTSTDTDYFTVEKGNKMGIIGRDGKDILSPLYDYISLTREFEPDLFFRVIKNDKYGLFRLDGTEFLPAEYNKIGKIIFGKKDLFQFLLVEKGGKKGIINFDGKVVIPVICDQIEYQSYDSFYSQNWFYKQEIMRIRVGDKWGFASCHDGVVVPPIYSEAHDFNGRFALVQRDGEYFMVDKEGYEYDSSGISTRRRPKLDTKRKIHFEEN